MPDEHDSDTQRPHGPVAADARPTLAKGDAGLVGAHAMDAALGTSLADTHGSQYAGDLPCVLIVTVNPLSTTSNNGKTFASFFEGYPREKLGQLYFHRELPSSDVCGNYYRVSDEEVFRFALGKVARLGGPVTSSTMSEQLLSPTVTRALASLRAVRLVRAAILSRILSRRDESLEAWVRSLGPQIIFFCGGDATYTYPLVANLASELDAHIATYITDDYVLPSFVGGPIAWLTRRIVRKHFLAMCKRSALVLSIGDKMTAAYNERFGIDSTPIMNLISVPAIQICRPTDGLETPTILCYAGGLHFNRWEVLARIGASLDRLSDRGLSAELHIYSATELDNRMARSLRKCRSIQLKGSVGQSELQGVLAGSDILVHVESFSPVDRASTRLSISTKIPEYLATGRSVLAVGPTDVASMEYLQSSGAAFVSTSLEDEVLDMVLQDAISNRELREHKSIIGLALARENHDAELARERLWRRLVAIVEGVSFRDEGTGSRNGKVTTPMAAQ